MNGDAENKNVPVVRTGYGWIHYILNTWISHLLITLGLLSILFLTAFLAKSWVDSKANALTRAFVLEDAATECSIVGSQEKQDFIKKQQSDIVKYANSHRETAIDFYGYFYTTYAIFSLFGLLAAISLAIIARKGIDEASPHMITVFFVATGIVILYQGFFDVFQQKTNIDNNAKLFVSYAKLNTRIDTYCTTGNLSLIDPNDVFIESLPKSLSKYSPANALPSAPAATNPVGSSAQPQSPSKVSTFYISPQPDEFINYVGWQMEQLKAISIAIDDSKIVAIDGSKLIITQP